jgi:hypothetical protein
MVSDISFENRKSGSQSAEYFLGLAHKTSIKLFSGKLQFLVKLFRKFPLATTCSLGSKISKIPKRLYPSPQHLFISSDSGFLLLCPLSG